MGVIYQVYTVRTNWSTGCLRILLEFIKFVCDSILNTNDLFYAGFKIIPFNN